MGELHFRFDVLPRRDGGWAYLLFRNGERLWSEGDLVKFPTGDLGEVPPDLDQTFSSVREAQTELQFERAGLRRAKAEGKRLGRPRIDEDTEAAIRKSLAAGMGIFKAARTHGVGTAVAQRIKHENATA